MKQIGLVVAVLLVILGVVGVVLGRNEADRVLVSPEGNVKGAGVEALKPEPQVLEWQDKVYEFGWFEVDNIEQLELTVNFPKSRHSTEIIRTDGCSQLINGGFYDKSNQPLGWIVSGGEEKSHQLKSQLLNGFVGVGGDGEMWMASEKVSDEVRLGLQSGPMLVEDGEVLPLSIANDEGRRRSVAILTTEGKLGFVTIFKQNSLLMGPYLEQLPEIAEALAEKLGIKVWAAMNLDGGTASAFWDGKLLLEEAKEIGSYWCVK